MKRIKSKQNTAQVTHPTQSFHDFEKKLQNCQKLQILQNFKRQNRQELQKVAKGKSANRGRTIFAAYHHGRTTGQMSMMLSLKKRRLGEVKTQMQGANDELDIQTKLVISGGWSCHFERLLCSCCVHVVMEASYA